MSTRGQKRDAAVARSTSRRERERLHAHAEEFTQLVQSVRASLASGRFTRVSLANLVEAVKAGMEITEIVAAARPGHEKLAVLTEAILMLIDESDFAGDYEPVVLTLVPHLVNTLIVVKDGKLRVNRGPWRKFRNTVRSFCVSLGCLMPKRPPAM